MQPQLVSVLFTESLSAWPSAAFNNSVKLELKNLKPDILPLNKATTQGGRIDDNHIDFTILNTSDSDHSLQIKAGVFFIEIIGGCNCGDEPHSVNGYCEIQVSINKETSETHFILLDD